MDDGGDMRSIGEDMDIYMKNILGEGFTHKTREENIGEKGSVQEQLTSLTKTLLPTLQKNTIP